MYIAGMTQEKHQDFHCGPFKMIKVLNLKREEKQ